MLLLTLIFILVILAIAGFLNAANLGPLFVIALAVILLWMLAR